MGFKLSNMNLSPLVAELLKTNDCVIVPDFGGFIANYQPSGYDERGDLFSPPTKEIIFSSKLKKNDGLLVNFVGEKEGVGYLEARKLLAEFVAETNFRLENGETIEFNEVGSIRLDQQENYLFEADPQINFRADAFGLESLHFPQLAVKHNLPPRTVFKDMEPMLQKRKYPALKYLLAGLPILALLYFIPIKKILNYGETHIQPVSNSATLSVTDSPVVPNSTIAPLSEQSELKSEATEPGNTELKNSEVANVRAAVEPEVTQPEKTLVQNSAPTTSTGKFHVVGGCFKIKENAEKLAEKLVKQGYPAAVSKHGREFYKVTVISFDTRIEAEEGLTKILRADPETGYWLKADM